VYGGERKTVKALWDTHIHSQIGKNHERKIGNNLRGIRRIAGIHCGRER
jgi:hypothetical protein